jgi:hypothetical protein
MRAGSDSGIKSRCGRQRPGPGAAECTSLMVTLGMNLPRGEKSLMTEPSVIGAYWLNQLSMNADSPVLGDTLFRVALTQKITAKVS